VELIGDAAFERTLSSFKELREQASNLFTQDFPEFDDNKEELANKIKNALYSSILVSYAQGFQMLGNCRKTEEEKLCGYPLDLEEIARIWRGGCIIRAEILNDFMEEFKEQPNLENLLLTDRFSKELNESMSSLRDVVDTAHDIEVPVSVLGDTISYYDSLRHERLPSAAMIQAMRDYFGSHTYHRVDDPESVYHTDWTGDKSEEKFE
ncbi:MAG: NADP-dependent phosphogluconate dehydrogenase, partial [Candidatus Magasanikbacteria bacterium]